MQQDGEWLERNKENGMVTQAEKFTRAGRILAKLDEWGMTLSSVQLFVDGSGSWHLNNVEAALERGIKPEQIFSLLGTQRFSLEAADNEVILDFCTTLEREPEL